VTTVCLLPLRTGCGCSEHPAFPCALSLFGAKVSASFGRIAPRSRETVFATETFAVAVHSGNTRCAMQQAAIAWQARAALP
jgi:hypothetical protein